MNTDAVMQEKVMLNMANFTYLIAIIFSLEIIYWGEKDKNDHFILPT